MSHSSYAKKMRIGAVVISIFIAGILIIFEIKPQPASLESFTIITIDDIHADPDEYFVVDVREREEFLQGHLVGARHVPIGTVLHDARVRQDIIRSAGEKTIVFFCHDGLRSSLGVGTMQAHGAEIALFRDAFAQVRTLSDEQSIWIGSRAYSLPSDFYTISREEVFLDVVPKNARAVDTTWDSHYKSEAIIAAPLMRMNKEQTRELVNEVAKKPFVALCNSRLSCFYGKILGYRAVKQGGTFDGVVHDTRFPETIRFE